MVISYEYARTHTVYRTTMPNAALKEKDRLLVATHRSIIVFTISFAQI